MARSSRSPGRLGLLASLALGVAVARPALAASALPTWRTLSWSTASGSHNGGGNQTEVAWRTEVHVKGSAWLRILFADASLGSGSYLLLRGANGEQRLDAVTLREWFNGSAYFAGDRVPIELHVAPQDRDVAVRIETVLAGDPGPGAKTLCGSDDRVASNDNRIGRLFQSGCTGWAISNGAFLTAGHCADVDPDNSGPLLPNGILDLGGVLEFNVPASQANGTLVPANVNDQYPVDVANVTWRFDGDGQGLGKDWCVFRVNRNANTLLLPWQAYGVPFRVTRELPFVDETVRVTGFGTDTGTTNQTNQTATGQFRGETTSGADIRLDHRVDSNPGNSGSPMLWEDMNVAIGIHTNGGCNSDAASLNLGTSFEVDAFENAINNAPGNGTRYVDALHPLRVAEEGTLFRPFATLQAAINATPTNGICSIYVGFYGIPAGTILNRAMTLQAPAGGVLVIGN